MRRLILGFLLCWVGFSFLAEVKKAVASYDARQRTWETPAFWRLGMPQPDRLELCLAGVRERVPAGSFVVFASPSGAQGAEFYRWRWAAYLLPEHHVIPPSHRQAGSLAQYFVTYDVRVENPRIEPMWRRPGCRLYRVRQP